MPPGQRTGGGRQKGANQAFITAAPCFSHPNL